MSGITSDAASTTFDGRNLSLTVSRQDGSRLRLDSARHAVPEFTETDVSPIAGHSYKEWAMLDYTNTSVSLSAAGVSWSNTDPTDYLAGGYWLHATGDFSSERITGVEMGAFVDGPELDGRASVPVSGTATYNGIAAGLWTYQYGSNWEVPEGTIGIGDYGASATLRADFGANTISGCIGCTGPMRVRGVVETPDGQTFADEDETYARVRFGPTPINSDGSFRNRAVSVELLGRTVTTSSGSWGGKFSNIADGVGDPRLVAGTNGAEWRESDGSRGAITGGFVGTK